MIYPNITFEDYQKLPGLNASTLKPYSISPRYGYFKEKKGFEKSHAMSLGTLVHALVLEGESAAQEVIDNKYITSGFPINPKTGNPYGEGTAKYKDWLSEQDPKKEVVFPVEIEVTKKISRAIASHEKSNKVLIRANQRETAITWTCPYTGFSCKALVDFFGNGIAGDLKTFGKQLTFTSIEREMYDRQYYLQFAFYRDGLIQNGFDVEEFYVIFAQNKDDYDVGCFDVCDLTLTQGQSDYIKAIHNYDKATNDKNEFKNGLFPEITTIGIPHWYIEDAPSVDTLGLTIGG